MDFRWFDLARTTVEMLESARVQTRVSRSLAQVQKDIHAGVQQVVAQCGKVGCLSGATDEV